MKPAASTPPTIDRPVRVNRFDIGFLQGKCLGIEKFWVSSSMCLAGGGILRASVTYDGWWAPLPVLGCIPYLNKGQYSHRWYARLPLVPPKSGKVSHP